MSSVADRKRYAAPTTAAPSAPSVRPAISLRLTTTGECPRPCSRRYPSRSRISATFTSASSNASHTSSPQHPRSTALLGPMPAGDTVAGSASAPAPTVLPVMSATAPSTVPTSLASRHRVSFASGSFSFEGVVSERTELELDVSRMS